MDIMPYSRNPVYLQKAKLVNLGLFALSRGEMQIVMAITAIIRERRWMHA